MDEKTRTLIKVRLERAREDLDTAEELLSLNRYRASINRAYYALFGITTALLLTKKLERTKHAGVEAAFNQYFVKSGIIEIEFGKIFDYVRKKREESDYATRTMIDKTTALNIVMDAKRFIDRIEKYLIQLMGKPNCNKK
jgi:uncharacterized protein (UPF0332 family)